jgi:hypothetical protein
VNKHYDYKYILPGLGWHLLCFVSGSGIAMRAVSRIRMFPQSQVVARPAGGGRAARGVYGAVCSWTGTERSSSVGQLEVVEHRGGFMKARFYDGDQGGDLTSAMEDVARGSRTRR